jgi:hypothetical protein
MLKSIQDGASDAEVELHYFMECSTISARGRELTTMSGHNRPGPDAKTSEPSMKTWRILLVGFPIALGCLLAAPIFAQQPDGTVCEELRFFPETRYKICDQFLAFFEENGGLSVFGFPVSEQMPEDGRQVQYFQRARLEYYPELPPSFRVRVGNLGEELAPDEHKPPIDASEIPKSNDPERKYFRETGHTVQHGFLAFFDENGAVETFGYPVTEIIHENGRKIQYFQKALMEWDPNRSGIVLQNIGTMWVHQQHRPGFLSNLAMSPSGSSSREDASDSAITSLSATASVRDAFSARVGDQTVWVYVTDQTGEPVAGARVNLGGQVFPGGMLPMPPTDEHGHTEKSFDFGGLDRGQLVVLSAHVSHQNLTALAQAFFYAWY